MSSRNMFDLIDRGYSGRWAQPGLDSIGPTETDLKLAKRREVLAEAKKGTLGQKPVRKTYYEKQLEKFGFR